MAGRGRGIRSRKVEPPRPRRQSSQSSTEGCSEPERLLLDKTLQRLSTGSLSASEASSLNQTLKSSGATLDKIDRDFMKRVLSGIRSCLKSSELNPLVRLYLLEVLELGARSWDTTPSIDRYYDRKYRELNARQRGFLKQCTHATEPWAYDAPPVKRQRAVSQIRPHTSRCEDWNQQLDRKQNEKSRSIACNQYITDRNVDVGVDILEDNCGAGDTPSREHKSRWTGPTSNKLENVKLDTSQGAQRGDCVHTFEPNSTDIVPLVDFHNNSSKGTLKVESDLYWGMPKLERNTANQEKTPVHFYVKFPDKSLGLRRPLSRNKPKRHVRTVSLPVTSFGDFVSTTSKNNFEKYNISVSSEPANMDLGPTWDDHDTHVDALSAQGSPMEWRSYVAETVIKHAYEWKDNQYQDAKLNNDSTYQVPNLLINRFSFENSSPNPVDFEFSSEALHKGASPELFVFTGDHDNATSTEQMRSNVSKLRLPKSFPQIMDTSQRSHHSSINTSLCESDISRISSRVGSTPSKQLDDSETSIKPPPGFGFTHLEAKSVDDKSSVSPRPSDHNNNDLRDPDGSRSFKSVDSSHEMPDMFNCRLNAESSSCVISPQVLPRTPVPPPPGFKHRPVSPSIVSPGFSPLDGNKPHKAVDPPPRFPPLPDQSATKGTDLNSIVSDLQKMEIEPNSYPERYPNTNMTNISNAEVARPKTCDPQASSDSCMGEGQYSQDFEEKLDAAEGGCSNKTDKDSSIHPDFLDDWESLSIADTGSDNLSVAHEDAASHDNYLPAINRMRMDQHEQWHKADHQSPAKSGIILLAFSEVDAKDILMPKVHGFIAMASNTTIKRIEDSNIAPGMVILQVVGNRKERKKATKLLLNRCKRRVYSKRRITHELGGQKAVERANGLVRSTSQPAEPQASTPQKNRCASSSDLQQPPRRISGQSPDANPDDASVTRHSDAVYDYGHGILGFDVSIPESSSGLVIGVGGSTVAKIQKMTDTKINIEKIAKAVDGRRKITITGPGELSISKAVYALEDLVETGIIPTQLPSFSCLDPARLKPTASSSSLNTDHDHYETASEGDHASPPTKTDSPPITSQNGSTPRKFNLSPKPVPDFEEGYMPKQGYQRQFSDITNLSTIPPPVPSPSGDNSDNWVFKRQMSSPAASSSPGVENRGNKPSKRERDACSTSVNNSSCDKSSDVTNMKHVQTSTSIKMGYTILVDNHVLNLQCTSEAILKEALDVLHEHFLARGESPVSNSSTTHKPLSCPGTPSSSATISPPRFDPNNNGSPIKNSSQDLKIKSIPVKSEPIALSDLPPLPDDDDDDIWTDNDDICLMSEIQSSIDSVTSPKDVTNKEKDLIIDVKRVTSTPAPVISNDLILPQTSLELSNIKKDSTKKTSLNCSNLNQGFVCDTSSKLQSLEETRFDSDSFDRTRTDSECTERTRTHSVDITRPRKYTGDSRSSVGSEASFDLEGLVRQDLERSVSYDDSLLDTRSKGSDRSRWNAMGYKVAMNVTRPPLHPMSSFQEVCRAEAMMASRNGPLSASKRREYFARTSRTYQAKIDAEANGGPKVLQYGQNFLLACAKSPFCKHPPLEWMGKSDLPDVCLTKAPAFFEPAEYLSPKEMDHYHVSRWRRHADLRYFNDDKPTSFTRPRHKSGPEFYENIR